MSAKYQDFYLDVVKVFSSKDPEVKQKFPEIGYLIERQERTPSLERKVWTKGDELLLQLHRTQKIAYYQIAVFAAGIIGFFAGLFAIWSLG